MTYGQNYAIRSLELKRAIKEGSINTIETLTQDLEKKHACYFCLQPIEGEIRILREMQFRHGHQVKVEYFIGIDCYKAALTMPLGSWIPC